MSVTDEIENIKWYFEIDVYEVERLKILYKEIAVNRFNFDTADQNDIIDAYRLHSVLKKRRRKWYRFLCCCFPFSRKKSIIFYE